MNDHAHPIIIKPSPKLLQKWHVQYFFVWIMCLLLIDSAILPVIIGTLLFSPEDSISFIAIMLFVDGFTIFLMLLPIPVLFPLLRKYFHTFEYRITEEFIEVHKGLINKTEKFVPYRTVTNLNTVYGFFDRRFGIGSVHIETAGSSGTVLPEERLLGLEDPEYVQNYILSKLKAYKSVYATTTEPIESQRHPASENLSSELLAVMKEIRDEVKAIGQKIDD